MKEHADREKIEDKPEYRVYPEEVVKNGGMTYIPSMIFRSEMGLKYAEIVYLCYLLTKPMDWIYYDDYCAKETGLGLSTIYEMNKHLATLFTKIPTKTGAYGTGYMINFSKLYAKCIVVGIEAKRKLQEKKEDRQRLEETVRNLEIDLHELATSLHKTNTTNTKTDTKDKNTNLSIDGSDREAFFEKNSEERVPPFGGTQDRKSEEIGGINESEPEDINIPENKTLAITYILDQQFGQYHYRNETREKLRGSLFRLPLADLKMIARHHETWPYWCKEISPKHGLEKLATSDFGLPLLLRPSILKKYLSYIREQEAQKKAEAERIRLEEEVRVRMEKKANALAKNLKAIEQMPVNERLSILLSFRFDKAEGGHFVPDEKNLENIARTNSLVGFGGDEMLVNILLRNYKDHMYQGMEDHRKWKAGIAKYSETKRLTILNDFDFSRIEDEVKIANYDVYLIAKKGHIKGNYEVLYKILEHEYPNDYYKQINLSPKEIDSFMASLQKDEERERNEQIQYMARESRRKANMDGRGGGLFLSNNPKVRFDDDMKNTIVTKDDTKKRMSHEEFEADLLASLAAEED